MIEGGGWQIGCDESRKLLWCQLKQTHADEFEDLGIMTSTVYWCGYQSPADGKIVMSPSGLRPESAVPPEFDGASVVDAAGWAVTIDASRNFLVEIDIDKLVHDLYTRLASIETPPLQQLMDRWVGIRQNLLASFGHFRSNLTELCLTSTMFKTIPRVKLLYPRLTTLLLNHGKLSKLPPEGSFPSLSESFPNLTILDLRHNRLVSPEGLGSWLLGLKHLRV